jgi:hypothetical protein
MNYVESTSEKIGRYDTYGNPKIVEIDENLVSRQNI